MPKLLLKKKFNSVFNLNTFSIVFTNKNGMDSYELINIFFRNLSITKYLFAINLYLFFLKRSFNEV